MKRRKGGNDAMYIKHVKPMKRAHNKKRSVYRGEKFVRKKSIDIAALLLVLLLAGSAVLLILSYFNGKIAL